jgi:hypothetical protein
MPSARPHKDPTAKSIGKATRAYQTARAGQRTS